MSPAHPRRLFAPHDVTPSVLGGENNGNSEEKLPRAMLKDLRAVGHKFDRFLSARAAWWRHAAKAERGQLPSWVRGLDGPPGEFQGDGLFACGVIVKEHGVRVSHPIFPTETTEKWAILWQRLDPQAPRALPDALEVPREANSPLWLALLRLRPLREFWDREMRRGTVDALLQMLPDAWLLDPTPVPSGAVIPRLDLASWSELPRLRSTKRSFALTGAHSDEIFALLDGASPASTWEEAVQQALSTFAEEPRVLVELPPPSDAESRFVVVFFERTATRIEGLGALALVPTAAGLVPARIVEA
ncbi:MAG: hypothetical protein ACOYMN_09460 [Roseimicrobium sp.]